MSPVIAAVVLAHVKQLSVFSLYLSLLHPRKASDNVSSSLTISGQLCAVRNNFPAIFLVVFTRFPAFHYSFINPFTIFLSLRLFLLVPKFSYLFSAVQDIISSTRQFCEAILLLQSTDRLVSSGFYQNEQIFFSSILLLSFGPIVRRT